VKSDTAIESVETHFVSVPLERTLMTATFPIPAIDTALVEVRTRGGHVGVGWCFAFGRGLVATLVDMLDELGARAIGHDALATGTLWSKLMRTVAFVGKKGVAASAISAIDTACWDIVGKHANMPVYKLLGGESGSVAAYASQGLWLDRSATELYAEAARYVEQGFTAVKMRVGLPDENEDVTRVQGVRDAIGPDIRLMVDVNQGWSLKQTLRMAHRLEECNLFWLEEPMPIQRVGDYAAATSHLDTAICTGETNYLKEEILEVCQRRATDYLMPDLMRMGGVTEWLKAAHVCEAFGIEVSPHLFMEHSAHLVAACPNAAWQEYMPWWQPLMETPVELVDGAIQLPDKPGFGIELSRRALENFKIR
jgi:L-alanine-DL-glutamate epimerase-like enolase superfamily enzyme